MVSFDILSKKYILKFYKSFKLKLRMIFKLKFRIKLVNTQYTKLIGVYNNHLQ